jgi:hypothetical protein
MCNSVTTAQYFPIKPYITLKIYNFSFIQLFLVFVVAVVVIVAVGCKSLYFIRGYGVFRGATR